MDASLSSYFGLTGTSIDGMEDVSWVITSSLNFEQMRCNLELNAQKVIMLAR